MLQLSTDNSEGNDGFLVALPRGTGDGSVPVYLTIQPNINGNFEVAVYDHKPEDVNDDSYRGFVTIAQYGNAVIADVGTEGDAPAHHVTMIPEVVKAGAVKAPKYGAPAPVTRPLPRQETYVARTDSQLPPVRPGMKKVRQGWRVSNVRGWVFPQN